MKKKGTDRGKWYAGAAVLVLCITAAGLLCFMGRQTENPSVPLTEEEVLAESRDREYCIKKGGITYTFRTDGILAVTGTGSTESFKNIEEAGNFFYMELYKLHTGTAPETPEEAAPFQAILDRVTAVEIAEGITALGDCSFTSFPYVETVSLPESLVEAGEYVFLGAGQGTGKELTITGTDTERICFSETSLLTINKLVEQKLEAESGKEAASAGTIVQEGISLPVRQENEQGTVPEEVLLAHRITLGDTLEASLYENGVLVLGGSGSTHDFKHYTELEQYIMEELHFVSRREVREQWFDKVSEILVTDGVERIGDYALAQYRYVNLISAEYITELGSRAFFHCGTGNSRNLTWNITLENVSFMEDTFLNCNSRPDTDGKE